MALYVLKWNKITFLVDKSKVLEASALKLNRSHQRRLAILFFKTNQVKNERNILLVALLVGRVCVCVGWHILTAGYFKARLMS